MSGCRAAQETAHAVLRSSGVSLGAAKAERSSQSATVLDSKLANPVFAQSGVYLPRRDQGLQAVLHHRHGAV